MPKTTHLPPERTIGSRARAKGQSAFAANMSTTPSNGLRGHIIRRILSLPGTWSHWVASRKQIDWNQPRDRKYPGKFTLAERAVSLLPEATWIRVCLCRTKRALLSVKKLFAAKQYILPILEVGWPLGCDTSTIRRDGGARMVYGLLLDALAAEALEPFVYQRTLQTTLADLMGSLRIVYYFW